MVSLIIKFVFRFCILYRKLMYFNGLICTREFSRKPHRFKTSHSLPCTFLTVWPFGSWRPMKTTRFHLLSHISIRLFVEEDLHAVPIYIVMDDTTVKLVRCCRIRTLFVQLFDAFF